MRPGQAAYHAVSIAAPWIADRLRGTFYDPHDDDDRIPTFLREVERLARPDSGTMAQSTGDTMDDLAERMRVLSIKEFDPEKVPGSILLAFNEVWPEGWSWQDEALWGEGDPEDDVTPLEPGKLYNILDCYLEPEEYGGEKRPLEDFVREFSQAEAEVSA